jgi:transposase
MTDQYARLTDDQWDKVSIFLPINRKRKYDLRDIIDAILWITRTGAQWRNLDSQFPPWQSVYYYFRRWTRYGIIETINDALNRIERVIIHDRKASPSLGLVDAQSVRLSPMIGTARGIDGNKWINGRKRSILTDTLGRIWRAAVHPANVHDGQAGKDLVEPDFHSQMYRLEKILGDKAYRGEFADLVNSVHVEFESPQRPEGQKGFVVEAKRWIVERTFAWLNFYRRLIKDYERTVESSESFLYLANIRMVLSSIARIEEKNF